MKWLVVRGHEMPVMSFKTVPIDTRCKNWAVSGSGHATRLLAHAHVHSSLTQTPAVSTSHTIVPGMTLNCDHRVGKQTIYYSRAFYWRFLRVWLVLKTAMMQYWDQSRWIWCADWFICVDPRWCFAHYQEANVRQYRWSCDQLEVKSASSSKLYGTYICGYDV